MSADEKRTRRAPKKMTLSRLKNVTAYYLQRHSTTRGHLKRLLMGRVRKSLHHHEGDAEEMAGWVDGVVDQAVQDGLVNDRYWASSRLKRLMKKGLSERAIRSNLRAKQVESTLIDELLAEAAPDPLLAAVRYARRRRIGPFREHTRAEKRDKDLGKLARAGFRFDIARQVLDMSQDDAETMIYG